MKRLPSIGAAIPDILLPVHSIDPARWAVIACDQYTSQPEYWQQVENLTAGSPSTLKLTLPEVYLEDNSVGERIQRIREEMRNYLATGLLEKHAYMIYVERTVHGKTRKGLMLALDLEQYDYSKGSSSLIRATEGTIVDRLPPRIKIREGAPLELPHILVLIDDPQRTVIEAVGERKDELAKLYDFELMLGSGHLTGYAVADADLEEQVVTGLEKLADPETFASKYGVAEGTPVLLYAMGDGNHSLATAKAIWEKIKGEAGPDHPARYALVEIENVHDEALEFEPIHRVLFGVKGSIFPAMEKHFGERVSFTRVASVDEMTERVKGAWGGQQVIGYVVENEIGLVTIENPTYNLAVGSLQEFLDGYLKEGGAEKIDYVHGEDVVVSLGSQPGNVGFYLAGMDKGELFKTVILDGALPRKTFSMGEAHEKRFYMEARRISLD